MGLQINGHYTFFLGPPKITPLLPVPNLVTVFAGARSIILPEKALLFISAAVGVEVEAGGAEVVVVIGVLVVEGVIEMGLVFFRIPFRGTSATGAANTVSGNALDLLLLSSMLSFCVDAARLSVLELLFFATFTAGLLCVRNPLPQPLFCFSPDTFLSTTGAFFVGT